MLAEYEVSNGNNAKITLLTTYPGLLIGSGYHHEVGIEGELKLGLQFGHLTGLPYIPSHSANGVIKSWLSQIVDNDGGGNVIMIAYYFKELFNFSQNDLLGMDWKWVLDRLFNDNNQNTPLSKVDVFLDAFPDKQTGLLFAEDNITPHKSPIKEPIPISFLVVREDVRFNFYFQLKDTQLTSNGTLSLTALDKMRLFERVLCDAGIGAKTTIGYGRLSSDLNQFDGLKFEYAKNVITYKDQRQQQDQKQHKKQFEGGGLNRDEIQVRNVIDERPVINMMAREIEADGWTLISEVKLSTVVRAKVLQYNAGNCKLQLFVKGQTELVNVQARLDEGHIINVMVLEVSGKKGTDNYKITKVKPLRS